MAREPELAAPARGQVDVTTTGNDQLEGGRLRVRFVPCADRLLHEVSVKCHGGWSVVLTSVEGDPSQDWPPSPPLQSLHIERPPGEHERALLVGMAGRSHWSASVMLDVHTSRLRFDIACRVPAGLTARLGVSYRSDWSIVIRDRHHALLSHPSGSDSPSLLIEADSLYARTRIERTADGISILAGHAETIETSHTIRWAYAPTIVPRGSLA